MQDSRAGWSLGSGFRAFKDVIANKVKFSEEGEEESDWGELDNINQFSSFSAVYPRYFLVS